MGVSLVVKFMNAPSLGAGDPTSMEVTFFNYPDEGRFFKNYCLFSWLGGIREGLKKRDDADFWQQQTYDFFQMLIDIRKKKEPKAQDLMEKIGLDQMGYIMYPVKILLDFDYDKVQETDVGLHPKGYTYRDQFENDLLPVLAHAKEHNYEYVIFGFES